MSDPKKIFISIDMEGISGIVDGRQTGGDTGEYQRGRKLMVGDLNAAVEGALEASVEEIVVSDAHGGAKNLQPDEVHEEALLIRGSPKMWSMMSGIGEEYDAALYVGYHSMKGTENGVLAHTISGGTVDGIFINGVEMGEFALNAALAGCFGVPSVFIAGDEAVAVEARRFVPNITTAVVKWAVGRYAAKCLHPKKAHEVIREKVKEALSRVGEVKPFRVDEPVEFKLRVTNSVGGDAALMLPFIERVDGRTVKATFDDYPTALKGLRSTISVAGGAIRR